MRTCSRCGAQFPDDELICPVCGQEVQLVPDYVTMESHMQEDELRKQEEEEKRREEEEREAAIEARKKEIRRNVILFSVLAAVAVVAIIIFVSLARANKNTNSYDYQYEHAQECYSDGQYDDALTYVQQALTLKPDSEDALYLEAQIYVGLENTDEAEAILASIISNDGDYTAAWELLIQLYEKAGDTNAIEKLLEGCKNDDILSKYAKYLVKTPVIDPDGGDYSDEFPEITISTEGTGTIYYTLDGTDPTTDSTKYTGPFKLGEGTTLVRAAAIADSGVSSDIAEATFNVTLEVPDAPVITPKSGTYTHVVGGDSPSSSSSSSSSSEDDSDESEITVDVPNGYTCYYSFDSKPTENSLKYTKPVKMREGEHVFYAVLQSKSGKLGKVASATYVYAETTPTPTPTATPKPTAKPTTATPNTVVKPTEVATPTPTATPTPESTPTPSPTSSASSSGAGEEQSGDGG